MINSIINRGTWKDLTTRYLYDIFLLYFEITLFAYRKDCKMNLADRKYLPHFVVVVTAYLVYNIFELFAPPRPVISPAENPTIRFPITEKILDYSGAGILIVAGVIALVLIAKLLWDLFTESGEEDDGDDDEEKNNDDQPDDLTPSNRIGDFFKSKN